MTARHRLPLDDREIHSPRRPMTAGLRAVEALAQTAYVSLGHDDGRRGPCVRARVLSTVDPLSIGRWLIVPTGAAEAAWVSAERVHLVGVARATDAEPTPQAAPGQTDFASYLAAVPS